MATPNEVKEFLRNTIKEARKQGIGQVGLAAFLHRFGIAIKDIQISAAKEFKPYILVEFINDSDEIEEARFDLVDVDGRSIEEIQKEMVK